MDTYSIAITDSQTAYVRLTLSTGDATGVPPGFSLLSEAYLAQYKAEHALPDDAAVLDALGIGYESALFEGVV